MTKVVGFDYQGIMPSLWLSVSEFYLRRFDPLFFFRRRGFFSSPIHRIRHTHTLTQLRPGPSGVTGLMVSLFDLMRQTLG